MTFSHTNQLNQLRKHNKPAYSKAKLLLHHGIINRAKKVMYDAMIELLEAQQPSLWQLIEQAIETQNIPTASKRQIRLTKQVSLRYLNDRYTVLYGFYTQSQPIIIWGQDTFNANSSNVGKWKLTFQAKNNFKTWQKEVELVNKKPSKIIGSIPTPNNPKLQTEIEDKINLMRGPIEKGIE